MSTINITNTGSKIETAKEISYNDEMNISVCLYLIGLILMLGVYFGPFVYYKIYKKKNFSPQSSLGITHAISNIY